MRAVHHEVQSIVHEDIAEAARENTYISLSTLRPKISLLAVEVPKSTMADWMGKMQLEYGEKKLSGLKVDYYLIRRYVLEQSSRADGRERVVPAEKFTT